MRGALFNILGDVQGLDVLDAFAGSGALSFEAISRGAATALAIELDRTAQRVIRQNIAALRLQNRVQLVGAAAGAWLQTNPQRRFNLVLCDPPYDDLQPNLLARLAQRVVPHGTFVLSWPTSQAQPHFAGKQLVHQGLYGDASLLFFQ